jgi:hypothetical protein
VAPVPTACARRKQHRPEVRCVLGARAFQTRSLPAAPVKAKAPAPLAEGPAPALSRSAAYAPRSYTALSSDTANFSTASVVSPCTALANMSVMMYFSITSDALRL